MRRFAWSGRRGEGVRGPGPGARNRTDGGGLVGAGREGPGPLTPSPRLPNRARRRVALRAPRRGDERGGGALGGIPSLGVGIWWRRPGDRPRHAPLWRERGGGGW